VFRGLAAPKRVEQDVLRLSVPGQFILTKMHLAIDVLESQLSLFLKLVRAAGLETAQLFQGI
jgi:hypothetical protein